MAQLATGSVAIWGNFYGDPDVSATQAEPGASGRQGTVYRVEMVAPVCGEPIRSLKPGSVILRMESPSRPTVSGVATLSPLFAGMTQHLQYTSQPQREELAGRSRAELPPSPDSVAVIIPIRKSAVWWAMAHDQRNAHFHKNAHAQGHTAIGAAYVDRIFRRLYHCRYCVEAAEFDFITYFEFHRDHTTDFRNLLVELRSPELNPEWQYVEREFEVWMTKTA